MKIISENVDSGTDRRDFDMALEITSSNIVVVAENISVLGWSSCMHSADQVIVKCVFSVYYAWESPRVLNLLRLMNVYNIPEWLLNA